MRCRARPSGGSWWMRSGRRGATTAPWPRSTTPTSPPGAGSDSVMGNFSYSQAITTLVIRDQITSETVLDIDKTSRRVKIKAICCDVTSLHCRCSDIHEDINRMYKKVIFPQTFSCRLLNISSPDMAIYLLC